MFSTLLAWLVVNKNIPDVMWNSIPEEGFKMIIIRSSVNFVNLNLIYHANKNFKMSTVQVTKTGLGPVVTVIMCYFFLKEALG